MNRLILIPLILLLGACALRNGGGLMPHRVGHVYGTVTIYQPGSPPETVFVDNRRSVRP